MAVPDEGEATGPWDNPALATFREWEPSWVDQCLTMSADPWTSGVLPRKDVELISLAVNAACTTLSAGGTRRHIRGALDAGASRDEIVMVLKVASLLSIHTCSLGAPILLEEAKAAGVKLTPKGPAATPVCDTMKAAGQWNTAWDGFFEIDPAWTEAIIAVSLTVYTSGVFTPKLAELLSIAVDASITHMYAPGTRRHIQSALKLGATMEEIMDVLKICVAAGMQASNLGVPILAEELKRAGTHVAEFVEVARLDELPPGKGTVVTIAGKDVALFNVDGTVYAMESACLHQGQSLGSSALDGCVVTCRAHGWRYNVTTGNTLHVPGYGVKTYPVKVVGGTILIALATPPSPTGEAEASG